MYTLARKTWKLLLVRGVLGIILGILILAWPTSTLVVVGTLLGAWLLVDGVTSIVAAWRGGDRSTSNRVLIGIIGAISAVAGLFGLFNPGAAVGAVALLFAIWLVATGISQVVLAWSIRKEVKGEWVLALSGILITVGGFGMLLWPGLSLSLLIILLGWYAIAWGVLEIVAALSLRKRIKDAQRRAL